MLSAEQRVLPDFVVIGCQRGGTSSLYKYLGQHPEIGPSLRKETEYLTVNYPLGERWYRAHFPLRLRRRFAAMAGKSMLAFEATPDYLLDPRAASRCKALIPDAKIVILLREPGQRALSHFNHNVRLGFETESFEDAIELEDERIAEDLIAIRDDMESRLFGFRRYTYLTRGHYADQIALWRRHYGSDSILVLESESFFADPASVLRTIQEFLGVKVWLPREFRNYSYLSKDQASHDQLPAAIRAVLDERLSPANDDLRRMEGVSLKWLEPGV
jgi:hypothetical protein